MPQKNMPNNWEPPNPAWSADFDHDVNQVIVAYLAAQSKDGDIAEFLTWIQSVLTTEHAPAHHERASYDDTSGYQNDVFICYWTDRSTFEKWNESDRVNEWWNNEQRLTANYGVWREIIIAPMNRLETLFSSEHAAGMAATTDNFVGPVQEHAYWGGARDRIPDSEHDNFNSDFETGLVRREAIDTHGKRIQVTAPANICLIRSAQNWTHCKNNELDIYLNDVQPVLKKGMDYIRDNPIDTGCISCRFMDELSIAGAQQTKTFGMAYFLTLGHLEQWAKSHPTHLAIFQTFHKMVQELNFQVDLRLWHEVIVLPEENHIFEYINCQPDSGLLPFFQ